jgi:hypothetical protein
LQYTTGHDNIKTTMRCVYPQTDAVRTLFARMAKSADKNGYTVESPSAVFSATC